MNAKFNQFAVLLIVLALALSACEPISSETPTAGQVQVKAINEGAISQNQITQVKIFDQCQSASPLTAEISFNETQSSERGEELILGMTTGGKVKLSEFAEAAIEANIQKHFSEKIGQSVGHSESIQIQAPPFTKQEYTIIWTEFRQEGTVDYEENGENLSVEFSYRVGVEFTSSSVVDLTCPDVTPAIGPVDILPGDGWTPNCISASVWSPSLSGESFSQSSDCYQLIQWGFAPIDGKLNMATQRQVFTAKDYGLFTPWRNQWTEVNLSIHAKRLKNSEIWVGLFADKAMSANGLVFVVQENDNFDVRIHPSEVEVISNVHLGSEDGNYERISLNTSGGKLRSTVDGQVVISDYPINFEIRYFYIGYRALPSMDLDAQISNLKFSP
jgi:hypothetical protein